VTAADKKGSTSPTQTHVAVSQELSGVASVSTPTSGAGVAAADGVTDGVGRAEGVTDDVGGAEGVADGVGVAVGVAVGVLAHAANEDEPAGEVVPIGQRIDVLVSSTQ
jgi:hypothetical protein